MHRTNIALCGLGLLLLVGALLGRAGDLSAQPVTWMLTGGLIVIASGLGWQHRRLCRTVWCVKVSEENIVGYDCARRKTTLKWDALQRVDVTDHALVLVRSPYCFFEISTAFFDYPTLSHSILAHAERHDVALCLDGRPLDAIDVYALYPFLTGEPPADAPGPAA
jgi:hypothetical protein